MISKLRLMAAAALVAGWGTAALASPAVLYADAAVRDGPGDEYKVLWNLVAGTHVDVRECNAEKWCHVVRRDREGWLKVETLDLYPGVDNEGSSQSEASSSVAVKEAASGGTGSRKPPGSNGGKFDAAGDSGGGGSAAIADKPAHSGGPAFSTLGGITETNAPSLGGGESNVMTTGPTCGRSC